MSDPLKEFDREYPPIDPVPTGVEAPAEPGDITIKSAPLPGGAPEPVPAADELVPPEAPAESSVPPIGDEGAHQDADIADVAVLFVHGMGEQKPGSMLAEYMNPPLEWIKRVTTDDHHTYHATNIDVNLLEGVNILERNRGVRQTDPRIADEWVDVETIKRGLLQSVNSTPGTFQPPYIDVELRKTTYTPQANDPAGTLTKEPTTRLVAVEGWWSKEFDPPPFKAVAQWGLGVAPTLILRHIALLFEQDSGRDATNVTPSEDGFRPDGFWMKALRWARAMLAMPIIGILGVLAQWLICALMLLSPIPFLKTYIRSIVLKLTTSLGDVLLYVHDGVTSAAIRTTVLRAVDWLYTTYTVKRLIVVSHSLGSVVSYDLLSTRNLSPKANEAGQRPPVTLVTFGSPLKKVNVILDLKRDEQRVSLGMLFAALSFFSAVVAVLSRANPEWFWAMKAPFQSGDDATGQWWVALLVVIGMFVLGVGAHTRPLAGLHLSLMQVTGLIATTAAGVMLIWIAPSPGWKAALAVPLVLGAIRTWQARRARSHFEHRPDRMSLTLSIGAVVVGMLVLATAMRFLPAWGFFVLLAFVFSILSASNPLEEFRADTPGAPYHRQMPKFLFSTPIAAWIDFWATKDLVPEFGLHGVQYGSPNPMPDPDVRSRRVTNNNSYLDDHTSYKANTEQFIAPMTRLVLEQLGYRSGTAAGPTGNTAAAAVGITRWESRGNPITDTPAARMQRYEQNIGNVMQSRVGRHRLLSTFGTLMLATFLLLSPGIARSLGEFIVFSAPESTAAPAETGSGAPVACASEGETPRSPCAPRWFVGFFNADPVSCESETCSVRVPPLIPHDLVESIMTSNQGRSIVLHGLGYAILVAIASLLRIALLTTPWRSWELALLDRVAQEAAITQSGRRSAFGTLSLNCIIRGMVFAAACAAVLLFVISLHRGWFWLGWVNDYNLTPWDTIVSIWNQLG